MNTLFIYIYIYIVCIIENQTRSVFDFSNCPNRPMEMINWLCICSPSFCGLLQQHMHFRHCLHCLALKSTVLTVIVTIIIQPLSVWSVSLWTVNHRYSACLKQSKVVFICGYHLYHTCPIFFVIGVSSMTRSFVVFLLSQTAQQHRYAEHIIATLR